ncbi:MAG: helix-turn-helix transcriptional regulator [Peptococcaceae bacterium]|nr:helix-turn-helix transcriptional regulator [Peptococcaceae bacterium]MEE0205454.1 helix-turn-helix transcriptional regulator [Peptococcaceae bacterium]
MITLDDMKKDLMKNPEFVKEYEAIQPEMDIIRAMIDARTAQHLTQKELAERTGINQADISKLENGTRNPTINLLKRLAEGMDMTLKIEFVPKKHAGES